jgi:hypothetical protein
LGEDGDLGVIEPNELQRNHLLGFTPGFLLLHSDCAGNLTSAIWPLTQTLGFSSVVA